MSILDAFFRRPNIEKLETNRDIKGLIKACKYKDNAVQAEAREALTRLRREEITEKYGTREQTRQSRKYPDRQKIKVEIDRKFPWKPMPEDIRMIQHQLTYGDFHQESARIGANEVYDRWKKENHKPQEGEFNAWVEKALLEAYQQFRTEEAQWREQDEAWQKRNDLLGLGLIFPVDWEKPPYVCPMCGAET